MAPIYGPRKVSAPQNMGIYERRSRNFNYTLVCFNQPGTFRTRESVSGCRPPRRIKTRWGGVFKKLLYMKEKCGTIKMVKLTEKHM